MGNGNSDEARAIAFLFSHLNSIPNPFSYAVAVQPSPTPLNVFKAFLFVGSTAFGGSLAAHLHNRLVRQYGWLSEMDFLEGLTLINLMPGPSISNLASYFGMRLAGSAGAVLAVLGVCLPGFFLVLALAGLYFGAQSLSNPVLNGALHGVAAAAVGVVATMLMRSVQAGLGSRGGWVLMLVAFGLVGVLRWNILWALGLLFPVALVLNRPTPNLEPSEDQP